VLRIGVDEMLVVVGEPADYKDLHLIGVEAVQGGGVPARRSRQLRDHLGDNAVVLRSHR
jgi:hypothetical protein